MMNMNMNCGTPISTSWWCSYCKAVSSFPSRR
ncbi:unnamed protein product [Spirodela intermedia]|uniref:Uncharacterized protein n=1 Tax=Spirodela intermedia TaxID=51605 RepID=A0A7I8JKS9_SPIIN|nr:unnamed protein product [Spirodela intermedia]CAA6670421.1 unnamed protein product [Spirodela intermedia]